MPPANLIILCCRLRGGCRQKPGPRALVANCECFPKILWILDMTPDWKSYRLFQNQCLENAPTFDKKHKAVRLASRDLCDSAFSRGTTGLGKFEKKEEVLLILADVLLDEYNFAKFRNLKEKGKTQSPPRKIKKKEKNNP